MEVSTPGRVCLFGEHQDYLGLPVIAMGISLRSLVKGTYRKDTMVVINKPDIKQVEKFDLNDFQYDTLRDYFKSGVNICKKFGFRFSKGFECEIRSNIPIKAGTSSSSSILVGWIYFLSQMADNAKHISRKKIAELAYDAEVIEFNSPGGMMDQYSTALGGLINLESEPEIAISPISSNLGAFVLGDSMEQKDTIGILSRCRDSRISIMSKINKTNPKINFHNIVNNDIDKYNLNNKERKLLEGTISNRGLVNKAIKELNKPDIDKESFGSLLNEQHNILNNIFNVSTSKIELMLKSALDAGAYGGKINGSGGGGCMFVYSPDNIDKVKKAINNAGGKAYAVHMAEGTKII